MQVCICACKNVADNATCFFSSVGGLQTFPSRLCLSTPLFLPSGCSAITAGLKAAPLTCRLHGFSDDRLIMSDTVVMCYKYAAACSSPLTVCGCLGACWRDEER